MIPRVKKNNNNTTFAKCHSVHRFRGANRTEQEKKKTIVTKPPELEGGNKIRLELYTSIRTQIQSHTQTCIKVSK